MNIDFFIKKLYFENCTFSRIEHEDAMVADVYKIVQSTKVPLILKVCTRIKDYRREVYFLRYFASMLPVPTLFQLIEPENAVSGAILMECLPGELVKPMDLTPALLYELGSLLARIHSNRESAYGDPTGKDWIHDPREYFSLKHEENLLECKSHFSSVLFEQCRRYFDTHREHLLAVDGPCVVHRDYRPGNLLVHDDKFSGIIDWASAGFGFSEEDFCSIEHGEWSISEFQKNAFFDGYKQFRAIPDYRKSMPLFRLNKSLAIIGFTLKCGTWNNHHAKLYQSNLQFVKNLLKNF